MNIAKAPTISSDDSVGFRTGTRVYRGLALADGNNDLFMDVPHVAQWAPLCVTWLNGLGL